jgi:hypothetical protein
MAYLPITHRQKENHMQYYVVDTTVGPQKVMHFDTYPEVVNYLEGMSIRRFGQTRKQRMILLEEVGHGEDDRQAVNFVRAMAETFNIGIVREGNLMRCDVTAVALYQKPEYGN